MLRHILHHKNTNEMHNFKKWSKTKTKILFAFKQTLQPNIFHMFISSNPSLSRPSWLLTRLPPAGSAVLLADSPAPHIWREKISGIPSCFTTELKKGSTDESGWLRDRVCVIIQWCSLIWAILVCVNMQTDFEQLYVIFNLGKQPKMWRISSGKTNQRNEVLNTDYTE